MAWKIWLIEDATKTDTKQASCRIRKNKDN